MGSAAQGLTVEHPDDGLRRQSAVRIPARPDKIGPRSGTGKVPIIEDLGAAN